jgi:hypothetical protein
MFGGGGTPNSRHSATEGVEEAFRLGGIGRAETNTSMSSPFVRVALSVAGAILFGVVLIAIGVPSSAAIGVSLASLIVGEFTARRVSTRQVVAAPVPVEGDVSSGDVTTFTNVAFSDKPPTWKGWSKDVGVLSLSPERVAIVGRKRQSAIDAPFTAELLNHKYLTWMMVTVTGSASNNQSTTMYLVLHGAPRTIGGADPEVVTQDSKDLVAEINTVESGRSLKVPMTPPEGFGERQSAVPWYRQKWVWMVGGIAVAVVVFLGPRLYNQYQANQALDKIENVTAVTISQNEIQAVIALDLSDKQVHTELQMMAAQLDREPLTDAELATIKEQVAAFDEVVADGASCDDLYKWVQDRHVNALGIMDVDAMVLTGSAIVGWGTAESWDMVIDCEL